jgi:hypothetical protein
MYMGDQLNTIDPTKHGCYLINLDDSSGNGTHWCGVFSNGKLSCYYDPLGLYPEDILWSKFPNLLVSDQQNQLETSILCGYYVCLFFGIMTVSPSVETFKSLTHEFFDKNQKSNDEILLNFFHDI